MATAAKSAISAKANLYCKNNCGFYGNSSWHGYCSVCYRDAYLKPKSRTDDAREHQQQQRQSSSAAATAVASSAAAAAAAGLSASFNQFEEKRRQVTGRGASTIKNLLKKPTDSAASARSRSPPAAAVSDDDSASTTGLSTISEVDKHSNYEYMTFVKSLPRAAGVDLTKQIKSAIARLKVLPAATASVEEFSDAAQEFYASLAKRIGAEPAYHRLTEQQRTDALFWAETFLTKRIYRTVFSQGPDEEAKDIALQKKLRSLHWVTPAILESRVSNNSPHFYEAVACLLALDTLVTPPAKLDSIVRCANHIFKALNEASGDAASADDFLPALIYVLLKGNPPRLQSNIAFITRFANSARLNTGEQGYYFTNLCCAVSFLESLNHESLSLPKELFDKFMTGQLSPATHGLSVAERVAQCLALLDAGSSRLNELDAKAKQLRTDMDSVEADMAKCVAEVRDQVAKHRAERPLRLPIKEGRVHQPAE
ncbi:hypothetical protein BOX15_Mlig013756g1 [Macrostomum lignano]|uniref:Uncharacterized protein n=2 Tax=Macrostomum lignano TaxID=282301 RepID=A0A267EW68_9PLAT|nr:hypothetical protein BOX15_Mlig013756g1 [Macrostomum lignano]